MSAPVSKRVLVAGAGGFIGGHLARRLVDQGHSVRCVDKKPYAEWFQVHPDAENAVLDLSTKESCHLATDGADEVYNLAADMGGMGFIEANKALCMLSVLINTHMLQASARNGVKRYFYASSACVYNEEKQRDTTGVPLREADAYPALPEDGYGWEKLFSERMCRHFREDFGLETRVARFHNVYGPHGSFAGGREKAPAAICRKVVEARRSGRHEIQIWGTGRQTRSFMYIDDCLEGIDLVHGGDYADPVNLGSSELVSIDQLVTLVEHIAGVELERVYVQDAPTGVNGRNSDNTLIRSLYDWEPSTPLAVGMERTYAWIEGEMLGAPHSSAATAASVDDPPAPLPQRDSCPASSSSTSTTDPTRQARAST